MTECRSRPNGAAHWVVAIAPNGGACVARVIARPAPGFVRLQFWDWIWDAPETDVFPAPVDPRTGEVLS
ncbi:MAG: hypothetical protein ONB06_08535 [candidate division KSB1 bacterium]|nr:hypothetical protein [candidate division KSB1 bacterium]